VSIIHCSRHDRVLENNLLVQVTCSRYKTNDLRCIRIIVSVYKWSTFKTRYMNPEYTMSDTEQVLLEGNKFKRYRTAAQKATSVPDTGQLYTRGVHEENLGENLSKLYLNGKNRLQSGLNLLD